MKIGKVIVLWQYNVVVKVLVFVMFLVVLVVCGEKKIVLGFSQVVVIVDGQEIIIYQVNNELVKIGGMQVIKQLFDGLVVCQLMINVVKKDKFDNDLVVVVDMEWVCNLVLVQSYVVGKLKVLVCLVDQEIDDFYCKNFDWFVQCK